MEDFPFKGSFKDKLFFLIGFGILAPSTHNTQPWRFRVKDDKVLIYANSERELPVGDRDKRFLYFSLGAAMENILIAGKHYNFLFETSYPKSLGEPIVLTAKIGDIVDSEELIYHIVNRISNRHIFKDILPEERVLKLVGDMREEGARVDIVMGGEQKERLVDLIKRTTHSVMSEPSFRKELAGYVKTNITGSKFGMPAYVMGVPTVISLLVPTVLKYVDVESFKTKKQEGAMNAPVFGVISTEEDALKDWVKAGQLFQKIALLATKYGLSTHPMAAPLHTETGYRELQSIINTNFRPQFLFRLGYGTEKAWHGPRMTVEDCAY